jgi:hypothetical protein
MGGACSMQGRDENMILEWILGKQGGKVWPGCIHLRIGQMAGSFKYSN